MKKFRLISQKVIHFLAYGFGSGLSPIMPGTCGTLVAIPIYLLMHSLPVFPYIIITALAFFTGIWICQITAQDLNLNDPSTIVWDEIVGFLITMIAVPFSLLWIITGFILFRIFDIWKPWPISWCNDNLHGGFGIMVDDLLAGICALIILHLIIFTCG